MFNMEVYYSDELKLIAKSPGTSEEERQAIQDELDLRKKDKVRGPSSGGEPTVRQRVRKR